MRVGALHQVGGFQIEYPRCDDYALLWRLSQIGDLRVLPTVAARYRVHADQVTTVDRGEQHREFIALRRRMHVSKLGHPVRSAPVIALTSKSPVSQRVFREVEELLDEHLRIALGDTGLSDSDSQWILDEHRRRLTRVRDRVSSGDPANSLKR